MIDLSKCWNCSTWILFSSILNVSVPLFLDSNDRSVWRDLFAVSGLRRAAVVPAVLSFSAAGVSDIWWDIEKYGSKNRVLAGFGIGGKFGKKVYTSWVDRGRLKMIKGMFEEDSEFARRMGVLLQEMEAAYNERVDFIKELEAVPGVNAAVKTSEFLIDALWKDERRL
ncbi:hypothetical protein Tco_0123444 [Tanacetum coccineum]